MVGEWTDKKKGGGGGGECIINAAISNSMMHTVTSVTIRLVLLTSSGLKDVIVRSKNNRHLNLSEIIALKVTPG